MQKHGVENAHFIHNNIFHRSNTMTRVQWTQNISIELLTHVWNKVTFYMMFYPFILHNNQIHY